MKFLLEFVPCCGTPAQRKGTEPLPGTEEEDDARSLVPPPPPRRRKRATRTTTTARSRPRSSSAEWTPSLCVISEDRAVMTTTAEILVGAPRKAGEAAGSLRAGRRTGGGSGGSSADRARGRDRDRGYRDKDEYEYGRTSLPTTVIPAFSPTPFMF